MNEIFEGKLHFEEESHITSSGNENISISQAAHVGAACAAAVKREEGKILVSHSLVNGANSLAYAFASGVASAGTDCIFLGECSASGAKYAAQELGCKMGCFIHTEITASICLFSSDGLPLFRATEEAIENALKSKVSLPYSHFGEITEFSGADRLYTEVMRKEVGGRLDGIDAEVYCSSPKILDICNDALKNCNDKNGSRIAFRISADGRRISAFSEQTGYVFGDKLILLCCRDLFEKGIDTAVCGNVPRSLSELAKKYGRRVFSCGKNICIKESSPSEKCRRARQIASQQRFMSDAPMLMMRTLEILRQKKITLLEAITSLPQYSDVNRFIPVNKPSELLERLCATDGVLTDSDSGRVTIRPVRTGKGVMLSVESYALETASELCDFYSQVIGRNS